MADVKEMRGWTKTEAIKRAGMSYNTWKRIANGTWAKGSGPGTGAPKPSTIDGILDGWFGGTPRYEYEKQTLYSIVGLSLIPADEKPAAPPLDPSLERIARLLTSPLISEPRKRRLRFRMDSAFLEDRAEAIAEGEPVLDGLSTEDQRG